MAEKNTTKRTAAKNGTARKAAAKNGTARKAAAKNGTAKNGTAKNGSTAPGGPTTQRTLATGRRVSTTPEQDATWTGPALDAATLLVPTKTHKMYSGGAFVRSESGATTRVEGHTGPAEVPAASRKDARDAVVAAASAQARWSRATPYLRGQVTYRVAEMLGSRADLPGTAEASLRWVHWAGWADKLGCVLGCVNSVSGPFDCVTAPTPVGVVAVSVPTGCDLAGFADLVAPAVCAGAAVVAVIDPADTHLLDFCEVLAVSDLPGGVVSILTGTRPEVLTTLAAHSGVASVDLTGAPAEQVADLMVEAAHHITRLRTATSPSDPLARLRFVTEARTTWHPRGR